MDLVTGLGAFKTMLDMAKGLKDITDATLRNSAIIELQEKILSAQEAQSALVQRVRDLEAAMARMEKWEAEKQRYELKSLPPGVFVYALKPEATSGEPPHYICQNCYEDGNKSHLHGSGVNNGVEIFECKRCGEKFRSGRFNPPHYRQP